MTEKKGAERQVPLKFRAICTLGEWLQTELSSILHSSHGGAVKAIEFVDMEGRREQFTRYTQICWSDESQTSVWDKPARKISRRQVFTFITRWQLMDTHREIFTISTKKGTSQRSDNRVRANNSEPMYIFDFHIQFIWFVFHLSAGVRCKRKCQGINQSHYMLIFGHNRYSICRLLVFLLFLHLLPQHLLTSN